MHTFGLSAHDGEGPQRCVGRGAVREVTAETGRAYPCRNLQAESTDGRRGAPCSVGDFSSIFFSREAPRAGWWEARTHG
jgi:hypothetical protein